MKQPNYTTSNRKGKHLTAEERQKLEALYRLGLAPACIAAQLGGRSERTIRRELARGLVDQLTGELKSYKTYSADVGQQRHEQLATGKGPNFKIGSDHKLVDYLEKSIQAGMSPYAAIANIRNNGFQFNTSICVKTVYNYLDKDLFLHISNRDLPVKCNRKKRDYHKIRRAITNTRGTSISERPVSIDTREEYGHWEMIPL